MPKYLDYEGRKKLRAWIGSHFLGKSESAADAALLGGKPPEYYAGPPRNLLVNSDFCIAQAGYGGTHGNERYAADRWRYNGQAGQVAMGDGLVFSDGFVIYQAIEGVNLADGQVRTLGVCTAEGKIGTCILSAGYTALGNTGYSGTYDTGQACYIIRGNGASAGIKWAALYSGAYTADTFPPPVPRPYSVELAECRRWYLPMDASQWYEAKRLHGDNPRIEVSGSFARKATLIGTPRMYLDDGLWYDMTVSSSNPLPDRCVFRFGGYDSLTTHGQSYIVTGLSGVSCEL